MNKTTLDTAAAIESLRTFALAQCTVGAHPRDYADRDVFVRFAHMCTAALNGELYAIERIQPALKAQARPSRDGGLLHHIRTTDTTRPDGAIARSFQA